MSQSDTPIRVESRASTPLIAPAADRWPSDGAPPETLDTLVLRSHLLGADRAVVNWGGGNTSMKARERDHAGREVEVLWVKGSGSDLADIPPAGFTGLRLVEIEPLRARDAMTDEEMIAYLSRCALEPEMPRSSIETLLHAFLPFKHVDHTHADAILMLCGSIDGERVTAECFGEQAVWIPYVRPGFQLAKRVAEEVAANPRARLVVLASHGLVTWGETSADCYASTLSAVNRAAAFVSERGAGYVVYGGPVRAPLAPERGDELLATVLPALRGAVSDHTPKVLQVDLSQDITDFVCARDAERLSGVGAACPDHLIQTKRLPLWVAFDGGNEDAGELSDRLRGAVARYRADYEAYYERFSDGSAPMADPNPRVVLIQGVGMITIGADLRAARLSGEFFHRSLAVMVGAEAVGGYSSLGEAESFAVEYWPLELYKLTLRPPPKELTGQVALVTGGAGGIGGAIVRRLAALGANVIVADIDDDGARSIAAQLDGAGLAARVDVTDESQVADAFRAAVRAFGGIDIVVSNAGLGSSSPVQTTTLQEWERNHTVLARGYFLVAREAFRILTEQGIGGSIVFVGSKNGLVAGRNAAAYSSAKATELHLARCLAEEGGAAGIRVNTVNPDAVLQGSRIWSSSWREDRAKTYGIEPEQLEEFYRQRTTLKVNVYPDDVAEAVAFLASPARAGKSTGNVINVDGGVPAAYPR